MWILLEEGDDIREGDEFWREKTDMWIPMSPDTYYFGTRVNDEHPPMRRNLTGWDSVRHALKAEVLGNDKEGCESVPYFWRCNCKTNYIHRYSGYELSEMCDRCETKHDNCDGPDARKAEVILEIIEEK